MESRKFERYEVSIPCTVAHMGETTRGRITDISMGGAFITELTGLNAFITVLAFSALTGLSRKGILINLSTGGRVGESWTRHRSPREFP